MVQTDAEKSVDQLIEKVQNSDSKVFIEIPQGEIVDPAEYKLWLVHELETRWMRDFNKNKDYHPRSEFNQEGIIAGYFGGVEIRSTLYRYDGTLPKESEDDYRAKRGFLFRDNYCIPAVGNVLLITDNLTAFLEQEGIEHTRIGFERRR